MIKKIKLDMKILEDVMDDHVEALKDLIKGHKEKLTRFDDEEDRKNMVLELIEESEEELKKKEKQYEELRVIFGKLIDSFQNLSDRRKVAIFRDRAIYLCKELERLYEKEKEIDDKILSSPDGKKALPLLKEKGKNIKNIIETTKDLVDMSEEGAKFIGKYDLDKNKPEISNMLEGVKNEKEKLKRYYNLANVNKNLVISIEKEILFEKLSRKLEEAFDLMEESKK